MNHPLDGIRVLDLGQIFMGSYCGTILSYLGAEVVKIEPPGGENIRTRSDDGYPPQVQFLNPGKRGVTLDLKDGRGTEALKDLAAEADVLVENYAPGTMERLGVGYGTLREINPGLVYAHGSGYGDDGPYSGYPAMDLTVQAMSGVMHTTGFPEDPPSAPARRSVTSSAASTSRPASRSPCSSASVTARASTSTSACSTACIRRSPRRSRRG